MAMSEEERVIRLRLKNDFVHYAKKCLKIGTKETDIIPFELNKAQIYFHNIAEDQKRRTGKVRIITVKGRQMGISTYISGRYFWYVTHRKGVKVFILTHAKEATKNLFKMARRFYDKCPQAVKPFEEASNANELIFADMDGSGYAVGTAGNKDVGRSSTIHFLHASEVAFWPNADTHAKGIIQAVPDVAGTEIVLESTANGIGNYFHEQWQLAQNGDSDYIPVFLPWYWEANYKREIDDEFVINEKEEELIQLYGLNAHQLMWRRKKIIELSFAGQDGEKSFQQEYPNTPVEAFSLSSEDTLIKPVHVDAARKRTVEGVGSLIIGCDPARYGDDRTSIIYRRGRKHFNLKSFKGKNTMEVAGILHNIIVNDNPDAVCIDVGGLGAGVIDRLKELGHKDIVHEINFGSSALDQVKYANKRAEMWGELNINLQKESMELPDSDTLHADLCAPKYSYDSQGRLLIEPKDKMKKRGLRSPDEGDALVLTYAIPQSALIKKVSKRSSDTARQLMSHSNRVTQLRAGHG